MSGTTCASPIYYCKEYFAALRKKCKLTYVYYVTHKALMEYYYVKNQIIEKYKYFHKYT